MGTEEGCNDGPKEGSVVGVREGACEGLADGEAEGLGVARTDIVELVANSISIIESWKVRLSHGPFTGNCHRTIMSNQSVISCVDSATKIGDVHTQSCFGIFFLFSLFCVFRFCSFAGRAPKN